MSGSGFLYLDCFAGVSGDMVVGALMDLGVGLEVLRRGVEAVGLGGRVELEVRRVRRGGVMGTKFDVVCKEEGVSHRGWWEIRGMLEGSGLSEEAKRRAISVFERIARAEARVHGIREEEVHFHEVGALDSIADVVCACVGMEELGWPRVRSGELVEGVGVVRCEHGEIPLPTPAVMEILRGVAVRQVGRRGEHITPTGAALVREFAEGFGMVPRMRVERVGYGAGSREGEGYPNVLRVLLGELLEEEKLGATSGWRREGEREVAAEEVVEVRVNLDDCSGEVVGHVMEELQRREGVLDVWSVGITMKKGRPGVVLHGLVEVGREREVAEVLLRETTAFGVRFHPCHRRVLGRKWEMVETKYGRVRMKLGYLDNELLKAEPEYGDCAALARESGVGLQEVMVAARAAWRKMKEGGGGG